MKQQLRYVGFNLVAVLTLASLLFVRESQAEIKSFKFTGKVESVDNHYSFLNESIAVGTPIEGYYIFSTDVSDSIDDPSSGEYAYTENTSSLMVRVGDYLFRSTPQQTDLLIGVVDRDTDHFVIHSFQNTCSHPLLMGEMNMQFDDPTGTALENDALPALPPDVNDFASRLLSIHGLNSSFHFDANVEAITEAEVAPETHPTTSADNAVEVTWPSEMGYFYQVQSSSNLSTWKDVGEPILGDGTTISKFFAKAPGSSLYYRAEIKNFDDTDGEANIVNIAFRGTVKTVSNDDDLLNNSIEIGTEITGFYVVDLSVEDSGSDSTVGQYRQTGSAPVLVAKIGDYTFRSHPRNPDILAFVVNRSHEDAFTIDSERNVSSKPLMIEGLYWRLVSTTNMPLTNIALPTIPLNVEDFAAYQTGIEVRGVDSRFSIEGTIDDITDNPAVITERPATQVAPSVEVKWQSKMGYYYNIQTSEDGETWQNLDQDPILGDGNVLSRFFQQLSGSQLLYRAELIEFEDLPSDRAVIKTGRAQSGPTLPSKITTSKINTLPVR